MTLTLSQQQQKQEVAYAVPYHWRITDRFDMKGRLYFGYIDFCVSLALSGRGPILDAGCGDGRFLGELSKKTEEKLYGVDYSSQAVAFAQSFVPDAETTVAGLMHLPYQNEFFQQIFLIETLEHIKPEEISSVLSELRRVLKRDGQLVITVPSLRLGTPGPESKHYQHFSPASLEQTLRGTFSVTMMYGQWRDGFHPLKVVYRLLDNSLYDLQPFRTLFNKYVWPKYLNICTPEKGNRLIAVCTAC